MNGLLTLLGAVWLVAMLALYLLPVLMLAGWAALRALGFVGTLVTFLAVCLVNPRCGARLWRDAGRRARIPAGA